MYRTTQSHKLLYGVHNYHSFFWDNLTFVKLFTFDPPD